MDFKSLLSQLDQLNEAAEKESSYVCVHAKKGKCNVKASSSYEAAKKAAEKWGLKSTSGIDAHLADSPKDPASLEEGIMDEPATKDTPTGRVHKAKPGGYGRKDDTDAEGNKVKTVAPKKGRGRPPKASDAEQGRPNAMKPDFSAFGVTGKDVKLPKWDKSKTTKHSLKEYFDSLDKALNEAEQIQIKPASQMPKLPGQTSIQRPGQPQQVAGQPQKNTQVIAQGNKTLGTVDNPQLAQQIKQSIGKGEMTLMPGEEMAEGHDEGKPGKNFAKIAKSAGARYGSKAAGERVAGAVRAKLAKQGKLEEGPHTQHYTPDPVKKPGVLSKVAGVAKKVFDKVAPGDDELLSRLEKSTGGKRPVKEADIPSDQSDMGAGLGAGRSQKTLEGKKPDFLDLDKDGDKKESMKKAAQDKKKTVKEGTDHRLMAAHHAGKSHALSKQNYSCKYDDMEESRMYHEGFKEGLDECYGQGMFEEAMPAATVPGMASQALDTSDMDEGNAFTGKLARTPHGGQFKLGGNSFTDTSNLDEFAHAFESWDNQLNSLLVEGEQVDEGMSVSISKGQQGAPDSVSVTAQDQDADALLSVIKQAGLGLFGGDEPTNPHDSSPMSAPADGEPAEIGAAGPEIDVVDDHDGMLALMKAMGGGAPEQASGYEDEEGHDEEACDSCGSTDCQCDSGEDSGEEEVVDEVESYDQEEEEVAEDGADSDEAETAADENAEASEDQALAIADAGQDEEEAVEESYANDTEDTFEADINFMTKVISGGLNKEKRDQTTLPHTAVKEVGESIDDWKKLSGIR